MRCLAHKQLLKASGALHPARLTRCITLPAAAATPHQTTNTGSSSKAAINRQQWYKDSSIFYSNYPLDRAEESRKDDAQLAAWFNLPTCRVTPVRGARILVTQQQPGNGSTNSSGNGSSSSSPAAHYPYKPVWISPAAELAGAASPSVPPLFLGLDASGGPHFALQINAEQQEALASSCAALWLPARTAGPDMAPDDAALMAVASGLAQWNLDAQFHGATGSSTQSKDGGFSRVCSSSGRTVYPRIDPAIITLVTCGSEYCLLGRKTGWPTGRYSTLAGFLELGESLEQALCREVAEESGVAVQLQSVRYVASQPWPFPRSLMVGFYASALPAAGAAAVGCGPVELLSHQGRMAMLDTGLTPSEVAEVLGAAGGAVGLQPPTPQQGEMEDVRWFHRDWLLAALKLGPAAASGGFMIPGRYSLAHKLITGWLGSDPTAAAANGEASSSSSSSSWAADAVPQVEIDSGVFKYVLLRLLDGQGRSKLLVRGAAAAAYHNHILQHTKAAVARLPGCAGLSVEVLGGGRIEHYPEQRCISVYGYSAAFGPAVHEVTAQLLRIWHPFYQPQDVTFSYEGY